MTATPPPGSTTPQPPRSLPARELQQRLERGEAIQLVDVREAEELALARLPLPVLHLPLSRSTEWMERLDALLDASRPVAVFCHAGVRSWHFGCWLMQQKGFPQVWNLQGGIDAWSVEVDRSVPRY
jgi:rhodanese-related sulfurtransferase